MKGTFFKRPLELHLLVEGETWHQGASISGQLKVRNHGAQEASLAGLRMLLGYGDFKHVHQKATDAFEILRSIPFEITQPLGAQQELSLPWQIPTDRNCPVTDKSASLFLLYGKDETPDQLGQLQIKMEPDPVISSFLEVFRAPFRFVIKSHKTTKEGVDFKLEPPSAKAFTPVEQLQVRFRFSNDTLQVRYTFTIKRVNPTAASMDLQKEKVVFKHSFGKNDYLIPSGRFNHTHIEGAITEIINALGLGTFVG